MQPTRSGPKLLLMILVAGVLLSVGLWFGVVRQPGRSQNQVSSVQTNAQPSATVSTSPGPLIATATNSSQKIATAVASLKSNSDPVGAAKNLEVLRKRLNDLGAQAASLTVQRWLDSGEDASTHQGFKLKADGSLKEAPTLRTFLLDYLVQIDPKAAAAYAEIILSSQNSSDEWAVALRAYARGNKTPDSQTFLRDKFKEMLANESWQSDPPVGFLEAFDVVVYNRDKVLTPDVAKLIQQKDNPAVAHAAYLALDRLVQVEPAAVLMQLQAQPSLMTGRETTRADYFARADVTDPQQRKVLEHYLLDASRTDVELAKFAEIYPNANYMVSQNLLTSTATPSGMELAARDAGSLKAVEEWLGDPRFARLVPQLQIVKSRLTQFVKQRDPKTP